ALAMPLPNWWPPPATRWNETKSFSPDRAPPAWWDLPAVSSGQVSPNVWHTPTGVFAMPFALLLFLAGLYALEVPRLSSMALVGAATVPSLLAKPNYVLVFAPCFAVAALVVYARAIRAGRLTVPAAAVQRGAARWARPPVLWCPTPGAPCAGKPPGKARVLSPPLPPWSTLPPNPPASVLLGIASPLAVAACYPRQVLRDWRVLLAWSVLAM